MAKLDAIYTSALFDLFLEVLSNTDEGSKKELEDSFLSQSEFLADVLGDADCQSVLNHPQITGAEKQAFLNKTLSGNIHEYLLGFLLLAINKNRESYILPAITNFAEKLKEYQRKTTAKVISAKPLDASQVSALKDMLAHKLNKHVDLELLVNPAVIGGINIYVDGYYIDRTIKKNLYDLKESVRINAVKYVPK